MRRSLATAGVAVVLLPLTLGGAAVPALASADSGDVAVTNTETVQAKLDATGKLLEARVYEQLALSGHGTTTIHNPVSTKGLRNLDGFGGYRVVDGQVVSQVTVDGQTRQRSVSDYDQDLPLSVKVEYTLDGEPVDAGNVVGRTGTLGVHYTVKNVTGKTQTVRYDDGTGKEASADAQTVVPMIGQLVTTLPTTFTEVESAEAGMAGDGHGGTRLTFQMTLFPPIGSDTAEFGYTAHITSGRVPAASLTSMAVSPLDYPSFKGGAASYKSGAEAGVKITGAGLQLDDGVMQLHDGAAALLAGLLRLREGAATLSAGLNNSAAPGAADLANGITGKALPGINELTAGLRGKAAPGAADLAAGLNERAAPGAAALALGAAKLDDGLSQASAKAPDLIDGLAQVDGGLALVDAGLVQLYGQIGGLPKDPDVLKLQAGITSLRTAAATLTAGVDQVRAGISGAAGSASTLSKGSVALGTQLSGAIGVLQTGLRPSGADPAYLAQYDGLLAQMSAAMPMLTNATSPDTIAGGAAALSSGLTGAAQNLAAIECGLSSAALPVCDPTKPGMVQGLALVDDGVTALITGVVKKVQGGVGDDNDVKEDNTLRGGIHSLQAGTDQLTAGGSTLVKGLGDLGTGAQQLRAGAGTLSTGIQDAAAGSAELSDGIKSAASGSALLAAGLADAASGSQSLADGLSDAADGSTQLSDGLAAAADGAPGLVDGTQQLSDDGTTVLTANGKETSADYGVKYAVLSAGAERAANESMAYGAPVGATGATAYSIEIAGADGSGVNTLGRLIFMIVLFAAGIGIATLVSRRTA